MRIKSKTSFFENELAWHKPKPIPYLVCVVNLVFQLNLHRYLACFSLGNFFRANEKANYNKNLQWHDYFHQSFENCSIWRLFSPGSPLWLHLIFPLQSPLHCSILPEQKWRIQLLQTTQENITIEFDPQLMVITDISTPWAEFIFRVKFPSRYELRRYKPPM